MIKNPLTKDQTIEALDHTASANAQTCVELMKVMRTIHDETNERRIRKLAYDAMSMSWLFE
jgi:hypothetical protein